MNDPKGSLWRKWDLHVHTPASIVHGYGNSGSEWDDFIADLEALPPEIKVLGINDYLFIDGYERLIDEKRYKGRLTNIDALFPVVEFRISKFAGVEFRNTKRINLHVIFSDELEVDSIKAQFLSALQQSYRLSHGVEEDLWSGVITRESLEELGRKIKESIPAGKVAQYGSDLIEGFNNLNLDEDKIFELLKAPRFRDKYLIAIGKTEWEKLEWTDGSIAEKKDIINKAHFVFTSAESIEICTRAREALTNQGVNDLLLDCSDAHTYSTEVHEKDRIGNCNCWIKADTTFEGLRQVLFERYDRLTVQESIPYESYPKPYFSSVSATEAKIFEDGSVRFAESQMPLNPNLVAVIGGRGTGKSLHLDAIAKTFGKTTKNDRARKIALAPDDFQVVYKKQDGSETNYKLGEDNSVDYLHIHQGEVKNIAAPESPDKLDAEIRNLLKLPSNNEIPAEFQDDAIERLINEIFQIKDWLNMRDSDGNSSNSPEFIEKRIAELKSLIGTITTEQNKSLISNYVQNLKKIATAEQHVELAKKIRDEIDSFVAQKNQEIAIINEYIENVGKKVPQIELTAQKDAVDSFVVSKEVEVKSFRNQNSEIESNFKEIGIRGDIGTLLEQLELYQGEINSLEQKLEDVRLKQAELAEKLEKVGEHAETVAKVHQGYIEAIGLKWQELKAGKGDWDDEQKQLIADLLRDIEIEGEERFDSSNFFELIKESLNLQKFRETQTQRQDDRLRATFNINCKDDFIRLLTGEQIIISEGGPMSMAELLDSDLFARGGAREFLRVCLLSTMREKFWKVLSKSKYKGKEIYELSVGQRGTFYVCLKLATDPFLKPFVFDQPEDDLDNDFIMHHLVPIFRKIKKYRQVIIVTHNANLVVNADAEQVIVATNEGEVLSYESGAIENDSIRAKVCNILEGGRQAFTRREQKYGIDELTSV